MAIAIEIPEPPAAADTPIDPELGAGSLCTQCQEQEAAEFIVRQVLERGANFRDG